MFNEILTTKNKSPGINKKEFILVHHTATGENSIKGILKALTVGSVSCHYVINVNGDIYKIGNDDDILWHAGVSQWGYKKSMNRYSIGIEIIGPILNGFTFEQRKKARELIVFLMNKYKIPKTNILRHADVTHAKSFKMILWDDKSINRKIDIDKRFLNDSNGNVKYKNWKVYQNSF